MIHTRLLRSDIRHPIDKDIRYYVYNSYTGSIYIYIVSYTFVYTTSYVFLYYGFDTEMRVPQCTTTWRHKASEFRAIFFFGEVVDELDSVTFYEGVHGNRRITRVVVSNIV